nr:phage/plasmid primase, P4 family [Bradyrhizobium sp. 2S1]MCK7667574.1 phage/plasmid primase, P4 family [Bradyrhizobium sp. 2S1]
MSDDFPNWDEHEAAERRRQELLACHRAEDDLDTRILGPDDPDMAAIRAQLRRRADQKPSVRNYEDEDHQRLRNDNDHDVRVQPATYGGRLKKSKQAEKSAPAHDIVTEDGAALQFVETHSDDLRFCHSTGCWYRWSGAHWAKDQIGTAFQWARELARQLAENQEAGRRYIAGKTSFASGVERFAKVDPRMAVIIDYWDRDPLLLGTPGGTVDLRAGDLRKSVRNDGITKLTSVTPSDHADCPLWLRFLDQTTDSDTELIRFLQQWCGYCLTGLTREHALAFIYGPGGNGKSMFLNIVTSILKDYAAASAMDTFTASCSDKHPTDLAMLRGARLVTASETEEGRAWAESRIKQITGGDPISARFMRQDFFEYVPQFKLTIIGNHQPVLHNVDEAARRRFNVIPFIRQPTTPDKHLEQKLIGESAGILRWMIDGCLDWQVNGLTRPASVQAATDSYFAEQDLFGQWLEDSCDVNIGDPKLWDKSVTLFESWTEYAVKAGDVPGSRKKFSQWMQKRGFVLHRVTATGDRAYRYIRLRPALATSGRGAF